MFPPREVHDMLVAHLTRITGAKFMCPVCGGKHFNTDSLVAPMGWTPAQDPTGQAQLGPDVTPMVVLSCLTCFHALHFLWLPIEKAAAQAKGGQ